MKNKETSNLLYTLETDLKNINWAYKKYFNEKLNNIFNDNNLSLESKLLIKKFFTRLLKKNRNNDIVLKLFLDLICNKKNIILYSPPLLQELLEIATIFTENAIYMGIKFFEIWNKENNILLPEDIKNFLTLTKYFFKFKVEEKIKIELAYQFIKNYFKIKKYFSNIDEIKEFINIGFKIGVQDIETAKNFISIKFKSTIAYIEKITEEIKLNNIKNLINNIINGLTGESFSIDAITNLDSDTLIENNSFIVSGYKTLYLPEKINLFNNKNDNYNFFILIASIAGLDYYYRGFSFYHGKNNYISSTEFISNYLKDTNENFILWINLFYIMEVLRILNKVKLLYPGIFKKLKLYFYKFYKLNSKSSLLYDLIKIFIIDNISKINELKKETLIKKLFSTNYDLLKKLLKIIRESNSSEETIKTLSKLKNEIITLSNLKNILSIQKINPLLFFPDYNFPLYPSYNIDNIKLTLKPTQKVDNNEKTSLILKTKNIKAKNKEEYQKKDNRFYYDEWNYFENDYYEKWCSLQEIIPSINKSLSNPQDDKEITLLAKKIKILFEKLKPELYKKEKFLPDGDEINIDNLISFLIDKKIRYEVKENFYEKRIKRERDISVAILFDISGSTGEKIDANNSILDLEKKSVYILSEGLSILNDKFSIYAFSGTGRNNSLFYIIKEFDEKWNLKSKNRLFSLTPISNTRVGVALRHCANKIKNLKNKKKLIILITDGKPMDEDYEFSNKYAQYDVRKAVEELKNYNINLFTITTSKVDITDLNIMFPLKNYIILQKISNLPELLSRLYLYLTY